MDPALRDALADLSATQHLLIGVDFDGTLAPLADEPMAVEPVKGGMTVLHQLADLDGATVALVSGRALGPLRQLTGAEGSIVLIGSHGAESSYRSELHLDDGDRARFDALAEGLDGVLVEHPRARVERKPAALVLHTRGLSADEADAATQAARSVAGRVPEVHLTAGKDVVEMAVTTADKGSALLELAASVRATRIVYVGDDVTDEHAFAQLTEPHISVKVGDGATRARFRVDDEQAVVDMLQTMYRLLGT
ncbi:MAG: trehalose-phosphatase [Ornithinimicrobium sp.]